LCLYSITSFFLSPSSLPSLFLNILISLPSLVAVPIPFLSRAEVDIDTPPTDTIDTLGSKAEEGRRGGPRILPVKWEIERECFIFGWEPGGRGKRFS
jgi:hypothetical protein